MSFVDNHTQPQLMSKFENLARAPEPPAASSNLASWYTPGLSDGLGDRLLMFDNTTSASLELLRFKRELGEAPGFEDALIERVCQLASFKHASFGTVRRVTRLGDGEGLALVSNQTVGQRLSDLLHVARGAGLAEQLVRRLAPALADLHDQGPGIAHGLLTPERIIVTPGGGLVLVEHVLASAIASLRLPPRQLHSAFGLAVPLDASEAALDARSDVRELGHLALSLLLGERINHGLGPDHVANLLDEVSRTSQSPRHLQLWLERALLDDGGTFSTAREATEALADWPEDLALPAEPPKPRFTLLTPRVRGPEHIEREQIEHELMEARRVEPEPELIDAAPRIEPEPAIIEAVPSIAARERVAQEPAAAEELEIALRRKFQRQDAESATAAPAASTSKWVIVGLAALSVAEAAVIAVLLLTRPVPAPAPVAETAVPPAALVATIQDEGQALPRAQTAGIGGAPVLPALERRPTAPAAPAGAASATGPVSSLAEGAPIAPEPAPAPAPIRGELVVTSEPGGAIVTVDGIRRGLTPLVVSVSPGEHAVLVTAGAYVTRQTVDVEPGKTVVSRADVPSSTVSVAAQPWANVWIDGQPLGRTPIANVVVLVGTHEVVLRHPELGERRQSIEVAPGSPVRLSISLSK